MAKLKPDEIEDIRNALAAQQQNSVEGSAFHEDYCDRCGYKDCICLYKARKKAIEDGPKATWIPMVLFIIAGCLIFKFLKHIF